MRPYASKPGSGVFKGIEAMKEKGPMRLLHLAPIIGCSVHNAIGNLKKAMAGGVVVRLSRGRYGVPGSFDPTLAIKHGELWQSRVNTAVAEMRNRGDLNVRQLAELLGIHPGAVNKNMRSGIDSGRVIHRGRGVYGVPEVDPGYKYVKKTKKPTKQQTGTSAFDLAGQIKPSVAMSPETCDESAGEQPIGAVHSGDRSTAAAHTAGARFVTVYRDAGPVSVARPRNTPNSIFQLAGML